MAKPRYDAARNAPPKMLSDAVDERLRAKAAWDADHPGVAAPDLASPADPRIGVLCRDGKAVHYAHIDGVYHEGSIAYLEELLGGPFVVNVLSRDGAESSRRFDRASEALAFCREEVKWESAARVACPVLGFDEKGDFA